MEHGGTNSYLHKLYALPFLYSEHIQEAFTKLQEKALSVGFCSLCDYICSTWIESTVSRPPPPQSWSVFNQSVRTNNDVEGWHGRLNYRAGNGNPPFCIVVLLDRESHLLKLQLQLARE